MNAYFGDIRTKIVDLLDNTNSTIKIAMAWFTNPVLFQIVLSKAASGKKIELIISDSESNFRKNGLEFDALQRKGGKVSIIRNFDKKFLHHKFAVIDDEIVITGSYNWSNSAQGNHENILVVKDTILASNFTKQFNHLYQSAAICSLEQFQLNWLPSPIEIPELDDIKLYNLALIFNQAVANAMIEAKELNIGLRIDIIDTMIKRYTAVGAARKLSNDEEQSGFLKLVEKNRPDLTFEYLTAKREFNSLFDSGTIKNAKEKLRPYLREKVETL